MIDPNPIFPHELILADYHVSAMISAPQWPRNPGNVVIAPNAHYENIYDLHIPVTARIHDLARGFALAMKSAWGCIGISTRQQNEPAGHQHNWHYYIHVTPRFHGDELYKTYVEEKVTMPPLDRARYARDLASRMTNWKPVTA